MGDTGTGNIVNDDQLEPTYYPSPADIAAGVVTLTLTADPLAPCLVSANSSILVNILPEPTVEAGPNDEICGITAYTISGASQTNATSILWTSSGTGTFSDSTTINPIYIPSNDDVALGAVTLTLTAANPACSDQSDYMVLTINSNPIVEAGAQDFICVSGSYTVTDASVSNSYDLLVWTIVPGSGNGTLLNPNSLTPTYIADATDEGTQVALLLTVTASAPCVGTVSDVKLLNVTSEPIALAGSDATICETYTYTVFDANPSNYASLNWTTNGSGTFIPQGEINPTYIPSDADIAMGSVILTLESANPPCLSDFDQMILTLEALPIVNAGNDATIDIGSSYTITNASVQNAANFVWSTSGTGDFDYEGIISPTYTPSNQDFALGSVQLMLTAYGQGNCAGNDVSDYMILTVTNYPPVDFFWNASCGGSPVEFFVDQTITDITQVVSFSWNFGDGNTSNIMDPVHTYAVPGTYSVTLTIVDVDDYSNTVQKFVEVYELPVVNFGFDNPVCSEGEVNFTSYATSPAGRIDEWTWDFGDGTTETITFPAQPHTTHTYVNSGTYFVSLSVITIDGCVAADIQTINVVAAPTPAFAYEGTCAGNSVQFTDLSQTNGGGNIISWSWNFGDPASGTENFSDLQNPTHAFAMAATYDVSLTVINVNGCEFTITEPVIVNPLPTVDIIADNNPVCLGEAINFSTTTPDIQNWLWNFGDGNTSNLPNPGHVYEFAGTYTVTLQIETVDGCMAENTLNVQVNNQPTALFTNTIPGCGLQTITFTDLSVSPNGAIVEWLWDFGDGNTSTLQNPYNDYLTAGTFIVSLSVIDETGCADTYQKTISIDIAPIANLAFEAACAGQPVIFTDLSSVNNGSNIIGWSWNFGDPASGTANNSIVQNPTHIFVGNMPTGGFTVSLMVTNVEGCTDTFEAQVILNEGQTITITTDNDIHCLGEIVQFSSDATNVESWLWNFGDGNTSTLANPGYIYTNSGDYEVTLVVVTNEGCIATAINTVTIYEEPIANFEHNSPICLDNDVEFINQSISPNGLIETWIWDFGDGNSTTIVAPDNPDVTHSYTSDGVYEVMLTVIDEGGCENSILKQIEVLKRPIAAFGITSTCFSGPISFEDQSNPASGGDIVSWLWNFGDNIVSTLQNPTHTYSSPGDYDVTLAVTNINGCADTTEIYTLTIEEEPEVDFTWENACLDAEVQFNNTWAGGDATYNWDFGDGNTSPLPDPVNIYDTSGEFEVTLTLTTNDGCIATATNFVTVYPMPTAN